MTVTKKNSVYFQRSPRSNGISQKIRDFQLQRKKLGRRRQRQYAIPRDIFLMNYRYQFDCKQKLQAAFEKLKKAYNKMLRYIKSII